MNRIITALSLLCFFTASVTVLGCSKKRPFQCSCVGATSGKNYDLDVKTAEEAKSKCLSMQPQYGWDTCHIIMHE